MMRFVVPLDATVAALGAGGAESGATLEAWRRLRPLESGGQLAGRGLVSRLKDLRGEGCEYLVVGAGALAGVDADQELRSFLAASSRVVAQDERVGAVYALREPHGERTAPDGLPLPPAGLIRITSGCVRQARNNPERLFESYWESGLAGAAWIERLLDRHGFRIEDRSAILDFGCGCGRVIRHWRRLAGSSLHGCDYNPHLVSWCAEALPFAEFRENGLEPDLPYERGSIDLVYAISIFTHLDEPLQLPWMAELERVLRPGGLLVLTVMGPGRLDAQRRPEVADRIREGRLAVVRGDQSGTNACSVYHPRSYVEHTMSSGWRLLAYEADGAEDVRQDAVLLQKPTGDQAA
jgi:SAM-dependent methyltransferase